jgi:hypothetical protein
VEGSVAEYILAVESSLVGEEHLAWRLEWRCKSASGVGAETHLYDLKVPADNCSVGTVSVKKSDLKKNLKGLCTQRTASFESGGREGGGGRGGRGSWRPRSGTWRTSMVQSGPVFKVSLIGCTSRCQQEDHGRHVSAR